MEESRSPPGKEMKRLRVMKGQKKEKVWPLIEWKEMERSRVKAKAGMSRLVSEDTFLRSVRPLQPQPWMTGSTGQSG